MGRKTVSLSLFGFQHQFDDFRALEIAKQIGAKAVDFCTDMWRFIIGTELIRPKKITIGF